MTAWPPRGVSQLVMENHAGVQCRHIAVSSETWPDMTLVCSDGHVSAHRSLLAAASPFLHHLLAENGRDGETDVAVSVAEVNTADVNIMLRLVYTGNATVTKKEMLQLMNVIKILKIQLGSYTVVTTDVGDKGLNHDSSCDTDISRFEKQMDTAAGSGEQIENRTSKKDAVNEDKKAVIDKVTSRTLNEKNALSKEDQLQIKIENNVRNAPTEIKLCYICDAKILGYNSFLQHLRLHGAQMGPYCCPWNACMRLFPTGLSLHRHVAEHIQGCDTGKQNWSCMECSVKFNSKSSLSHHRMAFHRKNTGYTCPENDCDIKFGGFKAFKDHMVKVHKIRPLKCVVCDQRFNDKAGLRIHTEAKHEKGRNHTCDICGKTFSTARFMAHHRKEQHEEGNKRRIKCPHCDVVSLGVRNLRKHRRIMHDDGITLFQCKDCSVTCKTRANLKVHQRIHTGENPFLCNFCTKRFKRKQHLTNHVKSLHFGKYSQSPSKDISSQGLRLESSTSMEAQVVEEMAVEYTFMEGDVIIPANGVVFLQAEPLITSFPQKQVIH